MPPPDHTYDGPIVEVDAGLRRDPIPHRVPQIGDQVSKEGYVWKFRIDEPLFCPENVKREYHQGVLIDNYHLERKTFFVVTIREKLDTGKNSWEFRLTHKDRSGEKLAVTMSIIASIKDAFFHGKKVKITGELSEERIYMPPGVSDPYRRILSVEILSD